MTTRCGAQAAINLSARVAFPVYLLKIVRVDGFTIRVTGHDRPLTFEGETYQPVGFAQLSAERREGGLSPGNQELKGVVDGDVVTVPDLVANRYRGAEVQQIVTDWRRPWAWTARTRKRVRAVTWTGTGYVATLEGLTQKLSRNAGGPRGGLFTVPCMYTLGDANTCRKAIGLGTGFAAPGGRVQTITRQRTDFTLEVASAPEVHEDDFYRDGSIEWLWSAPLVSGTVTSATTSTTLIDTTKAWTINQWVGYWARLLSAGSLTPTQGAWGRITANTATQLTFAFSGTTLAPTFPIGQAYDICADAANIGTVSPVVRYVHTTRRFELLIKTPFDIAVGDSGVVRAGCDGLLQTCGPKFDNVLNHGGDPHAPSAQDLLEPPEDG